MTLITPEHKKRDILEEDLVALKEVFQDLKAQMEDLKQKVRAGEVEKVKEASKTLQELRGWMKVAMDTEKALNDIVREDTGLTDKPYAIDLAAAREKIGCRMARIVPCCKARGMAE